MGIILSIETTTDICSVAVHNSASLLAYLEVHISKSHSEKLTIMIREALKFSGLAVSEVDAIALSKGPGSYTGLRVGTSTAKGLCMALDKPLISVNTLLTMAFELSLYYKEDVLLCPMLDARRMEVYCALYDCKLNEELKTNALILDEHSFSEEMKHRKIIFFGSGAQKFKNIVKNKNAYFLEEKYPRAQFVGKIAETLYQNHQFEELHSFEPFYLKDFVLNKKV